MIKISQAIIVEGKYDKIKLTSIIDALIIEVNGFQIFKDKEKCKMIKHLAETCGIIILTDSDSAGLMIRNYISKITNSTNVYQAFVPEIVGKEKRKLSASKEGFLGVEGVNKQHIIDALNKCGVAFDNEEKRPKNSLNNTDFFRLGLTGDKNSAILRKMILKHFNLPSNLSKNSMIKILNNYTNLNELESLSIKFKEEIINGR